MEKSLCESGISYTIYDKTVANPTTTNVAEALELYYLRGCDCIIGLGGGSSIDCAKAVGGGKNRKVKTISGENERNLKGT